MKLVIAEYLRTLREREELDRLLPDLLAEMGYTLVARPQTGNRQFGVDLAARGPSPTNVAGDLLLLVVKQGDIGRTEWDGGNQSVRQSINEIFDSYLQSHIEPNDKSRNIRIIVATNGELKQVVQPNWSGFVAQNESRALIEFWGVDEIAGLIARHLLDEHVFRDEDRKLLRRSLALSGDSDYNQIDLHRLFLRALGLLNNGQLAGEPKTVKALIKALRITNFAAQIFATWSINDGDARQGLRAMERALLWSWHRIQLENREPLSEEIVNALASMWRGYQNVATTYFEKLQRHCYVEDGLTIYSLDGCELSIVAFEQIGILATVGLSQILMGNPGNHDNDTARQNAETVATALSLLIKNNEICGSPCFDRHSHDITLALMLFVLTGKVEFAKDWLRKLVRNIDYAFKVKKYVPIATDSIDDLVDEGGWRGGATEPSRFFRRAPGLSHAAMGS